MNPFRLYSTGKGRTRRTGGLRRTRFLIGGALLGLVALSGQARAAGSELEVRYVDGRLSVQAQNADPLTILERVGRATGLDVVHNGNAEGNAEVSVVVNALSLEAGLAQLFDKLSQSLTISYVMLYDSVGPARIIVVFGKGESNSTLVTRKPEASAFDKEESEGLTKRDRRRLENALRDKVEHLQKYETPEDLIRDEIERELDGHDLSEEERRNILDEVMRGTALAKDDGSTTRK